MRFAIVNDLRIAQEILRHAVAQIPGASVAVSGIFRARSTRHRAVA